MLTNCDLKLTILTHFHLRNNNIDPILTLKHQILTNCDILPSKLATLTNFLLEKRIGIAAVCRIFAVETLGKKIFNFPRSFTDRQRQLGAASAHWNDAHGPQEGHQPLDQSPSLEPAARGRGEKLPSRWRWHCQRQRRAAQGHCQEEFREKR